SAGPVRDGPPVPGWARAAAVLLGAALYALALPPWDWACLGWVALVPLILAVRRQSTVRAFWFGLAYGVGCAWGVAGWLAQAMGRYFALGFPLGVLAAMGYAIAFWGSAFGLFAAGTAVLLRSERSLATRLVVPALWVATELLRGRFLGQPWALLGYSQHAHIALIQVAALTGVYGVSFVVAFGNVAIAEALALVAARGRPRQVLATLALPVMLVAPLWAAGALVARRGPAGGFAGRSVAVVQANLSPAFEWTRAYADREAAAVQRRLRAGGAPGLRPARRLHLPRGPVPRAVRAGGRRGGRASRERLQRRLARRGERRRQPAALRDGGHPRRRDPPLPRARRDDRRLGDHRSLRSGGREPGSGRDGGRHGIGCRAKRPHTVRPPRRRVRL